MEVDRAIRETPHKLLERVIRKVFARCNAYDFGALASHVFDANQDVRRRPAPGVREAEDVFQ